MTPDVRAMVMRSLKRQVAETTDALADERNTRERLLYVSAEAVKLIDDETEAGVPQDEIVRHVWYWLTNAMNDPNFIREAVYDESSE